MKHYIFALIALGTVLFASCSSEDESLQNSYSADNIVHVTADVNDIDTRASYTINTLTEFGLSIQNQKNNKYCYGNNKVTKSGDVWSPAPQMLWENYDQKVNIYAYAPYNSSYTGNIYQETRFPVSVSTDQTSDDDKSDFLLFKYSSFKPTTGIVPITFNHALSQLKINITFGNEFNTPALLTTNPIKEIRVIGTKVNATCDFATQSITVGEKESSVSAQQTSFTAATTENKATATYSCILIPQVIATNGFKIKIVINKNEYTWTSTQAVILQQGQCHQLNLTVGKDAVSINDITVKDWVTGNTITGGEPQSVQ